MRRLRLALVLIAFTATLSAAACGGGEEQPPEAVEESSPEAVTEVPADEITAEAEAIEEAAESEVSELPYEDFDRNTFDRPTVIDNQWFPLRPGTQLVYEGVTVEDGEEIAHRVIFAVTDLTKVIGGVRTVVAWDQDYSEGELVETELAFFAQDNDGNVWHFGQYPEEYEDGTFVEAPTWIHGIEDARAGILMKGEPQLGAPSYSQGWGPEVEYTDRTQVYQLGEETCVPVDCYEDVLVMDEFDAEEPGAFQLKYYAAGVGNVRVGWRGDDPSQETLELVELVALTEAELAEVRAGVLALEESAYQHSPDVYGPTAAMEPAVG